jgi:hypothetical protein
MSADDFFSRWSRRKQEGEDLKNPDTAPVAPDAPVIPTEPAEPLPPPTLDDVAALTHEADFRRFVAPGVDETVRRSAMKKLFTDPHFNVMDGLDIYIDDYNKFEPLPAAMLAMLEHAKPLLDPLGHLKLPALRMLDLVPEQAEQGAQAPAEVTPNEATPNEATPDEATPDEATPDEATPDEATPDEATPAEAEAGPQAPRNDGESAVDALPQPAAGAAAASDEAPPAEAPAPTPQDIEAPKDEHSI